MKWTPGDVETSNLNLFQVQILREGLQVCWQACGQILRFQGRRNCRMEKVTGEKDAGSERQVKSAEL